MLKQSSSKSRLVKLKIVDPSYLRFEIGDRVCTQNFTTDEVSAYSAAYGSVHGIMYVSPKVLEANNEWGRTGWFYWVLFDRTINESDASAYFDFVHESDVFSPAEMCRWDNPKVLIRLLIQSVARKLTFWRPL